MITINQILVRLINVVIYLNIKTLKKLINLNA